ncbi:zinc-ribbon domain-containing protein [Roseovarius sp. S1116L3]|uniref:zinc-ribbon domain-containing protein n=1 Tax=Roseovarius roseus TaxID=3342636 RepID=UPI003728EC99
MRLTCPNCGAQYEVPDEVIPESGRDVQCSNCGDTWFQPHRDQVEAEAQDDSVSAPSTDDWQEEAPKPAPVPPAAEGFTAPPNAAKEDISKPDIAKEDMAKDAPARKAEPSEPPSDRPERPERREIDPSVASVLREEAEREKRARAAAQGGVETQPDLGLDDDDGEARREREARQRMARMRGLDDEERGGDRPNRHPGDDDASDIDPKSRKSLFPDIEEINSSLGPDPAAGAGAAAAGYDAYPEAQPHQPGGFRRGFLISLLIAVIALLVYVYAAPLADMLPALRGVLADYAAWVDGLRVWLDGQVAALMLWLDTVTGTTPTGGTG